MFQKRTLTLTSSSNVVLSSGVLKMAAVISTFMLAIYLAFHLLEIRADFRLGSMTSE